MPGFLGMFCRTTLPWYYLSRLERQRFENDTLYYSVGWWPDWKRGNASSAKATSCFARTITCSSRPCGTSGDHRLQPQGYEHKAWQLPDDWRGERRSVPDHIGRLRAQAAGRSRSGRKTDLCRWAGRGCFHRAARSQRSTMKLNKTMQQIQRRAGLAAMMTAMVMTSTVVGGAEVGQPATSVRGLGDEFIKNAKFGIFVHYTVEYAHLSPGKPRPAVWDLDAPNAGRLAVALRAGNPDAVIWQNSAADVPAGLSLECAWRACEGGDPSHGEKDQCCILPTENAWFLGKGSADPGGRDLPRRGPLCRPPRPERRRPRCPDALRGRLCSQGEADDG